MSKITLIEDGDIFLSTMQTIVIPVNLLGTMGKGLAKSAAKRYWGLEFIYKQGCSSGEFNTKAPMLIMHKNWFRTNHRQNGGMRSSIRKPRWLLLIATKIDWRNPSKLEYITDGLEWLENHYQGSGIQSIAVPALGCGLGGLEWDDVYPVIDQTLQNIDLPAEIYLPKGE